MGRLLWVVAGVVASATALALVNVGGASYERPDTGRPRLVTRGLFAPTAFAFHRGTIFVSDGGDGVKGGGVYVIQAGKAVKLPESPDSSFGLVWHADTLYVSAGNRILAWSGWNGSAFAKRRIVTTAPRGFPGFNGLAWGPKSRLYTGVALASEVYDHRHPKLPFANDYLTVDPADGKIAVVARGLRQPWQGVFGPGLKGPIVSELGGSDPGHPDPPDLLVIAAPGADFGFPTCLRSEPARCRKFTKPWLSFPAHSSPMGLALRGTTLYIAFYGGGAHLAEIGRVSISGGAVTVAASGFAAPLIAVGVTGDRLYAGDVTGAIWQARA